jgi:glycosyltransferase involved in cell wall biosynthesis
MRRIRVVQLVAGIAIGDQSGGAEQIGIHLARYLDREAFESAVFAMRGYGSTAESQWLAKLSGEGIPVYGLVQSAGSSLQDLNRSLRALWSFVDAFRPDVINSHSERGDTLNALIRLLHPIHPRAVRTMHTDQQWQTRPVSGAILTQGLFPLVFDAEIAISLAVRVALEKRLLARGRHRKAALCYEGIDGSQFNQLSETSEQVSVPNGLPPNRPRIGIVGRLAEQKGHTYILQAMPLIRRIIPAHLVVIGTGSLDATLQAEAQRLGVQDYVHFLGSRNDVLEILPHLDLIVSASLWEGLPAAILEAMTMGVPVVATDVSGSREVVQTGQTGILVPAADPVSLAKATIALLTDRAEALRMAHNARRAAAQYTVQNAAPCYGEVYRKLIATRHSSE